ncbi:unnamed protein product [Paramecium octaurelia]|uniref:Transmembrane protein n=1 Tax=Paramecium octaurelia TaxID=43137 RepID=A0A8S1VEG3_PAROT|nr:unnamed protein product [Paramecium octaurelia]
MLYLATQILINTNKYHFRNSIFHFREYLKRVLSPIEEFIFLQNIDIFLYYLLQKEWIRNILFKNKQLQKIKHCIQIADCQTSQDISKVISIHPQIQNEQHNSESNLDSQLNLRVVELTQKYTHMWKTIIFYKFNIIALIINICCIKHWMYQPKSSFNINQVQPIQCSQFQHIQRMIQLQQYLFLIKQFRNSHDVTRIQISKLRRTINISRIIRANTFQLKSFYSPLLIKSFLQICLIVLSQELYSNPVSIALHESFKIQSYTNHEYFTMI